ncbi:hypothetical protein TTHERM_00444800 (macronuclear) [Tetrahymena thermophila SB210]|uniref:Uncharacterized protein n=1 Tax=Tetrahymena thermophila (strain SB210) TaxID=312017 RepID=I7MLU7_TETTS|nr:hypothetical protein TTHERM_00444800 [Tetrahymena thermophila SB210]6YNX_S Chain S, ATPTT13 [Tetrahymena thermophila]6YNX_s Chain s, ATPTT13 [Tetrahymena thermophila]6YNY_S Chain S, ATPTT13 [Tetrahymena thermophila]6YNY_s Chain s, ATPTT13 [Tetrahymena thermophila]6YNZ_S Chain S, ATPTT13 [Tetrahymena thermophila]6YNZ_S3 Chain S3, ATPTT13 [Tetrahymena thermophila]6YNZ_s Chain s, ATPTT13 [Tetrahymena thermophila]6YNZ_s3 Chain s3, ATPTT13 [Tetrahymena thermophila]6YO0_s Chain s, ATPTT13 [Te|eukprot:XP_001023343.2 hypothetical protein TTHERM_00444800 [Tetrahymena thermophila SB210]
MNSLSSKKANSLVFKSIRNFTLQWGSLAERPMVDRVMSTSTWPVPYYQRLFKAYPIREKKDKMSLLLSDIDIDDTNWYQAKDFLRGSFRGRQIVDYVENNIASNTYILIQQDVANMAKAYVHDICGYIDVANKENVRILSKGDLI